jgi:hypothetical protein
MIEEGVNTIYIDWKHLETFTMRDIFSNLFGVYEDEMRRSVHMLVQSEREN